MAMTEKRKKYLLEYQKANLKRVPLDMRLDDYRELKSAAVAAGMSVNGYIKQAVAEKIARENPSGTAGT